MFMFAMCMICKICSVYDSDVQAYCLYPKIYNYNTNYMAYVDLAVMSQ